MGKVGRLIGVAIACRCATARSAVVAVVSGGVAIGLAVAGGTESSGGCNVACRFLEFSTGLVLAEALGSHAGEGEVFIDSSCSDNCSEAGMNLSSFGM